MPEPQPSSLADRIRHAVQQQDTERLEALLSELQADPGIHIQQQADYAEAANLIGNVQRDVHIHQGTSPQLTAALDALLAFLQRETSQAATASTTPVRDLAPGDIIDGKYRLVRILGEGGNGAVWLAEEQLPAGTRKVAIKMLHRKHSQDATRIERFKRELTTAAQLDHDHIVTVHTYGEYAGHFYVVMQYIAGVTLRDHIRDRAFSLEEALVWLSQAADALAYAHAQGVGAHRDVKPENMLLTTTDRLYLTDFGLAFSAERGRGDITASHERPGSGRYMAPEQWRDQEIDHRTDVYALGVIAYELLTGHLPFVADNDQDLGHLHCEAALPSDSHLQDEVLRILAKAAAKRPEDRYTTPPDFIADLRQWELDPANLNRRVADYLDGLYQHVYQMIHDQFVDLSGDRRALLAHSAAESAHDDFLLPTYEDFFARLSAEVQADHVDAVERQTTFVENVRERLLRIDRGVLVGEPGSGKTWMLLRLLLEYAEVWRGERPDPAGRAQPLIPVLVPLNLFRGGTEEQPQAFADFVRAQMRTLAAYHDRLLREGRLALLCDALNEMPRTGPEGRDLLDELRTYLADVSCFTVSCRVRDYRDDLGSLKPLEQVVLRDLELPAIRDLVMKALPGAQGRALWAEIGGGEALERFWQQVNEHERGPDFWQPRAEFDDMWNWKDFNYSSYRDWRAMHSGARLIPLCRKPFMARLVTTIYEKGKGRLPESRGQLFASFVDILLDREARNARRRGTALPPAAAIKTALVALAKALQAEQVTTLRQNAAVQAVGGDKAETLLQAAADANLLAEDGDNLRFAHQLIQEYFAAQTMLEALEAWEHGQPGLRPADFFDDPWWDAGVWRETTVILGEFLGEGARGPNRVARWLAAHSPEVALEVILRNAEGLTLGDVETDSREVLLAGARARNWRGDSDPRGRASIMRVLGRFQEDNRDGVGLDASGLPDIDWVSIPAGEFWMGSDPTKDPQAKGRDNEFPQRLVPVKETFEIARYPVTYAQYAAFVNDSSEHPEGGYAVDRYWTAAGLKWRGEKRQPEWGWNEPAWHIANHPVIGVTWYEAYAFCQWLSARTGHQVTLPTETQWEYAARGTDGRIYPYGNAFDPNRGNTSATGIGRTTAVGLFPDPALPFGLLDMSGNVWEWCLTKWRDSYTESEEDNDPDGTALRVLRGGSFADDQVSARAAARIWSIPGYWFSLGGFRVVRLLPPSL